MKIILFIGVVGADKNPWNGNHRTWGPSSESSWRGDMIYVSCYPLHPSIPPSIHPSIGCNVFFTCCTRSWRLRRCSAPSPLATVWTVPSTSPRWWARAQPTPSRRPAGKVSVSFSEPHFYYPAGSRSVHVSDSLWNDSSLLSFSSRLSSFRGGDHSQPGHWRLPLLEQELGQSGRLCDLSASESWPYHPWPPPHTAGLVRLKFKQTQKQQTAEVWMAVGLFPLFHIRAKMWDVRFSM